MFNPERPVFYRHPQYLSSSGARHDVIDPATLATVGTIADTTGDEINAVLNAVTTAQKQWKALDAKSRATILHKVAARIEATDMRRCGEIMSREMGKPYPEAIGEIANCAGAFRYFAEMARDDAGKVAGTTQVAIVSTARLTSRSCSTCMS